MALTTGDFTAFNIFDVINEYVSRMLPEDGTMKVLLVDKETLDIISVAFSQTELLQHGVFLVDDIEGTENRQKLPTMRCICFVRPSSIPAVCAEIQTNKYQSYTLIFSNIVTAENLDQLARHDTSDAVVRVEEFFADFIAVNRETFIVPFPRNVISQHQLAAANYRRVAEGIAASFVAMRRKPMIRFNSSSPLSKRVATELGAILQSDPELYNYRHKDSVLLILDRSEDPVTPLLTPWTYQAMLHELVGLDKNKLFLPDAEGEDANGFVFSQKDDDFFAKNMHHNYGDLCTNVKAYVDHCKSILNIDRSTATIDEVKQFMQKLPQTRQIAGSVTKHATVVSHLSAVIKQRGLLDISQLEQDMVMNVNQSDHFARLQQLCQSGTAGPSDVLRLCMLFNLRYEKGASPSRTDPLLVNHPKQHLVKNLRDYYTSGNGAKSVDYLFATTNNVLGSVASFVKGFSDIKNIFTQHEPVLKKTVLAAGQGRLDVEQYPYLTPPPSTGITGPGGMPVVKPKDIIVFMCGGFTFEEAALAHTINNGWRGPDGQLAGTSSSAGPLPDVKVLLGGTGIHNTQSFLASLASGGDAVGIPAGLTPL